VAKEGDVGKFATGFKALASLIAVGLWLAGATTGAKADIVYVLSGVQFDDGGTLTGSFTLNMYGYLESYSLTSTLGTTITGYSYESPAPAAGGIIPNSPPGSGILLFPNINPEQSALQLTFKFPFSSLGVDPIVTGSSGPSWECEGSYSCQFTGQLTNVYGYGGGPIWGPTRFVTEGIATAVPEASTWMMLLLGFAGVGFFAYRRQSPTVDLSDVPRHLNVA
jgi:hypothetical protein